MNSVCMFVDLKSAVSQLSSRTNVQTVCCEAIMNSLHAGANEVTVELYENHIPREELDLDDDNKNKLQKLIITDNGDGFTNENIKSFLNLYSPHKADLGCKGIGRLSYLKVFENVRIDSTSEDGGKSCNFNYDLSHKSFQNATAEDNKKSGTTITYSNPKCSKSAHGIPLDFTKIVDDVYKNIMPHLYLDKEGIKVIFKHLKGSETVSEIIKDSKTLPELSEEVFIIQESVSTAKKKFKFTLSYVITKNESVQDKDVMKGYFCANKRSVYSFSDKNIGDSKIPLKAISGYNILFLAESKYLDSPQRIDPDRQTFDIDPTYNEVDSPISWQMINKPLLEVIERILLARFPSLKDDGEKLIDKVRNEHLHLASYVEAPNRIGGIYSEKHFIDRAETKFKQDKAEFFKNKDSWRPEKVIRKASDIAGKELIEYIQMRDQIITQLEKVADDKGSNEQELHNLILDMKKTANEKTVFSLENNNLWLIDDKFMGFSQVASDVDINTILNLESIENKGDVESKRRPDIAAFYRDDSQTKLVLFELKKTNAGTFDASKGIDQLSLYAKKFRATGVQEIYLYLLSAINEDAKDVLKERGFQTIYSKDGQYMFGTVGSVPCSLSVLDARAVISDARARNQTFINMVKKGFNEDQEVNPRHHQK